jgi:hypothetical protein
MTVVGCLNTAAMHDTVETGEGPLYVLQLRGRDYKTKCKSSQFNERTPHNIRELDKFNAAILVHYLGFTMPAVSVTVKVVQQVITLALPIGVSFMEYRDGTSKRNVYIYLPKYMASYPPLP